MRGGVRQSVAALLAICLLGGSDRVYGLIVHAYMYYLFTFNRDQENCAVLSAEELGGLREVAR